MRRFTWKAPNLLSSTSWDIAERVDDVALDLDATIVRYGAVESLRANHWGFVTVTGFSWSDDHGVVISSTSG
jgi:hypothetical protein